MSKVLIPDRLHSDEQYNRFYHFDIPYMEIQELADELHYLRARLWGLPADDWRRERVRMLEDELAKRKRYTCQAFRAQSKPKLAEGVKL